MIQFSRQFQTVIQMDNGPCDRTQLQVSVSFAGPPDPTTGMIINLKDVDRWIEDFKNQIKTTENLLSLLKRGFSFFESLSCGHSIQVSSFQVVSEQGRRFLWNRQKLFLQQGAWWTFFSPHARKWVDWCFEFQTENDLTEIQQFLSEIEVHKNVEQLLDRIQQEKSKKAWSLSFVQIWNEEKTTARKITF